MIIKEVTLYHIADYGHIITSKPMTLDEIRSALGPVKVLEARGLRVIKAGKRVYETVNNNEGYVFGDKIGKVA